MATQTAVDNPTPPPAHEKPMPAVGPIPLPAFVALVMLGPFCISFILWVTYLYTIKRCINKRRLAQEERAGRGEKYRKREASKDIEMQVRSFVTETKPSVTRSARAAAPRAHVGRISRAAGSAQSPYGRDGSVQNFSRITPPKPTVRFQ